MKRRLISVLLCGALASCALAVPAQAQFGSGIVFDPTNYAQNLLTAARELQQVNNEILSLQNEATMLINEGKNLSSLNLSTLTGITSALTDTSNLLNQAGGIALTVDATSTAFTQTFPQSYATGTSASGLAADALQRWQNAMSAFQTTLKMQAQITQNVQSDATTLSTLVNASQGAAGNLEAVQAGNQLQALAIKQQLQLQSLMAAQYRATSLDDARKSQDEAAGQADFTTFLGTANGYTPN